MERQRVIQSPVTQSTGVFAVSLEGEIDIAERARVLDAFAQATTWPVIIVDFERTRYVDSTVLECLVALGRAAQKRGADLVVVGLRPEIRRIFEICDLQRHFEIRATSSDVIGTLGTRETDVYRMSLVAEPSLEIGNIEAYRTEVSW
ncbi:MAG: STAS domain-containing protein [Alphaproteobacteria bacterium]|nr:STAS domain-containing protein [Alphaproteobacteria bacterium]